MSAGTVEHAAPAGEMPPEVRTRRPSNWTWALVPLLAMVAYAPVLGIGFLSDDYVLLWTARQTGINLPALLPGPYLPGTGC